MAPAKTIKLFLMCTMFGLLDHKLCQITDCQCALPVFEEVREWVEYICNDERSPRIARKQMQFDTLLRQEEGEIDFMLLKQEIAIRGITLTRLRYERTKALKRM